MADQTLAQRVDQLPNDLATKIWSLTRRRCLAAAQQVALGHALEMECNLLLELDISAAHPSAAWGALRFRGCGPSGLSGAFPTLIKPMRLRGVARAEGASWDRKCRIRAYGNAQELASTRFRKTAL
jgi:hypothetical protein